MDAVKKLKTAEANFNSLVKSAGLSCFSRCNQEFLLEKLSFEEAKCFAKVYKKINNGKIFTCEYEGTPIYITSNVWFCIGRDTKCLQATNHTLYTFCDEFGVKPSELKES